MSKLLIILDDDRTLEIVNLKSVWISYKHFLGIGYYWSLEYSDAKYECNTVYLSKSRKDIVRAYSKIIQSYKNNEHSIQL